MNKEARKVVSIIVCICLVVLLYFFTESKQRTEIDSGYRIVMGTFAHIVAVAKSPSIAQKSIEAAFAEIQKVDDLMSDYKTDSEISNVNKDAAKKAVKVSKATFEVLQRGIKFSKLTDGAFDITIGPLVDLWHRAAEANSIPTEAELQQARSKVGYEKLILDANEMSVKFAVEGMRLDLGGIAKGYAADKAVESMQNCGAIGAMVAVGGDIRCFGVPPAGRTHWLIGLQDPNDKIKNRNSEIENLIEVGKPLLTLKLKDAAVSTSGNYRRFALIDGKKHSHIINRTTGASAEGLSSVTIIAENATDADALATTVSVLGAEKGLALIKSIPGTEAILISPSPYYELTKTSGAEKFIK